MEPQLQASGLTKMEGDVEKQFCGISSVMNIREV